MPGLLPALREFKQWDYERIANVTKPFILRRVKEEVLTELPEKIESVHVSELTIEQKELYLAYLHDLQQETSAHLSAGSFPEHRMKNLPDLTRLRQIFIRCSWKLPAVRWAGVGRKSTSLDSSRVASSYGL